MPRQSREGKGTVDGRVSRRRFLAAAGAALGAGLSLPVVIPASALGADGKVAPSNRIGVGMIGLGRQSLAHNLPVFMRASDAQVVALCDVDRWRLQVSQDMPPRWPARNATSTTSTP